MDHVNPRDESIRLQKAGDIIARRAKFNSARFSVRIPRSISVKLSSLSTSVTVEANGTIAPNAAPFEYAEHHPLFGNRRHWYRQPHRPFMADAWKEVGNAAVDEYAKVVDDWCQDLGFS